MLGSNRRVSMAVLALMLLPTAALGCLWDYDTIKMERTRYPGTLELITGKFLRHSPEFYRWRIDNRLKRLESDPNSAALLDDLAVAYDKTGQHDKAIETALRTEKARPGRYETSSNLSTFYFHAGRLEEARAPIDRALAINPDAHFGREKYQKQLLEYVIKRSKGGPLTFPLCNLNPLPCEQTYQTFDEYIDPHHRHGKEERSATIKAVLGMMKFANFESPVLLEALGTLLAQEHSDAAIDAKQLAARAYLKASYGVPEGSAREKYRDMAQLLLMYQTPHSDRPEPDTLGWAERGFQKELAESRAWYADLREQELSWIRDGKNPEVEFDKLYEAEPEVSGMDVKDPMTPPERIRLFMIASGAACSFCFLSAVTGVVFLARRRLRRRANRTSEMASEPE
jgi:tetratricopeptide (TPR) repeat protein